MAPLRMNHSTARMFHKSTIRAIPRGLMAALIWAMMPLIVWGGLPTFTCACAVCHCGGQCALNGPGATSPSSVAGAGHKSAFGPAKSCCTELQSGDCCCCRNHNPSQTSRVNDSKTTGLSEHACKLAVWQTQVIPTVAASADQQPSVLLAVLPSSDVAISLPMLSRRLSPAANPPPLDRVVALRHLLI